MFTSCIVRVDTVYLCKECFERGREVSIHKVIHECGCLELVDVREFENVQIFKVIGSRVSTPYIHN